MFSVTTMTGDGQITLPAEVREALQLQEGDRVVLDVDGEGQVTLRRPRTPVERTSGILQTDRPPMTEAEIRSMKQERATAKHVRTFNEHSVVERNAGIFRSNRPPATEADIEAAWGEAAIERDMQSQLRD